MQNKTGKKGAVGEGRSRGMVAGHVTLQEWPTPRHGVGVRVQPVRKRVGSCALVFGDERIDGIDVCLVAHDAIGDQASECRTCESRTPKVGPTVCRKLLCNTRRRPTRRPAVEKRDGTCSKGATSERRRARLSRPSKARKRNVGIDETVAMRAVIPAERCVPTHVDRETRPDDPRVGLYGLPGAKGPNGVDEALYKGIPVSQAHKRAARDRFETALVEIKRVGRRTATITGGACMSGARGRWPD